MKVISYAEEHIVTTDGIAEEVIAYARELGLRSLADTVKVPALYADGHVGEVQLLIGPASQLSILDSSPVSIEVEGEEEFLADIRRRTASIRPSRAATLQENVGDNTDYDPDAPIDLA